MAVGARAAVGSRLRREQHNRSSQYSTGSAAPAVRGWLTRENRSGDFIILSDSSTTESLLTRDNLALSPSIYTLQSLRSLHELAQASTSRHNQAPASTSSTGVYRQGSGVYRQGCLATTGSATLSGFDRVYQPTTVRISAATTNNNNQQTASGEQPAANGIQIIQVHVHDNYFEL